MQFVASLDSSGVRSNPCLRSRDADSVIVDETFFRRVPSEDVKEGHPIAHRLIGFPLSVNRYTYSQPRCVLCPDLMGLEDPVGDSDKVFWVQQEYLAACHYKDCHLDVIDTPNEHYAHAEVCVCGDGPESSGSNRTRRRLLQLLCDEMWEVPSGQRGECSLNGSG